MHQKTPRIPNQCLFFSRFSGCWVFSNFVIFDQIKVSKISGNHAAIWWQKLAADFPSLKWVKLSAVWTLKYFRRIVKFTLGRKVHKNEIVAFIEPNLCFNQFKINGLMVLSIWFQGSVNENSPAGTSILEVSASDDDAGENGKVYYRYRFDT